MDSPQLAYTDGLFPVVFFPNEHRRATIIYKFLSEKQNKLAANMIAYESKDVVK